jgi:hypothetical protein
MLMTFLIVLFVSFAEQLLGTLDIISTIQRKLILNFIVVWLGVFFSMVIFKVLIENASESDIYMYIALFYSTMSAITSVVVIKGQSKWRRYRSMKKLREGQKKYWNKKHEDDRVQDECEERCETLTEGESR